MQVEPAIGADLSGMYCEDGPCLCVDIETDDQESLGGIEVSVWGERVDKDQLWGTMDLRSTHVGEQDIPVRLGGDVILWPHLRKTNIPNGSFDLCMSLPKSGRYLAQVQADGRRPATAVWEFPKAHAKVVLAPYKKDLFIDDGPAVRSRPSEVAQPDASGPPTQPGPAATKALDCACCGGGQELAGEQLQRQAAAEELCVKAGHRCDEGCPQAP